MAYLEANEVSISNSRFINNSLALETTLRGKLVGGCVFAETYSLNGSNSEIRNTSVVVRLDSGKSGQMAYIGIGK